MVVEEIRRAIEAAPRVSLPTLTALVWSAVVEGRVTEEEAGKLIDLIEGRKLVPAPEPARVKRSVGSRPRTNASLERRRRWVASGRLPPQLAAHFTMGEAAVLAVVAAETVRRKDCRLAVGALAAIAGVSETTARNAIREAARLGLLTVEQRRITGWRNDTNVVRIVSAEWAAWLRLAKGRREGGLSTSLHRETRTAGTAAKGGGCKIPRGTPTSSSRSENSVDRHRRKAAGRQRLTPA